MGLLDQVGGALGGALGQGGVKAMLLQQLVAMLSKPVLLTVHVMPEQFDPIPGPPVTVFVFAPVVRIELSGNLMPFATCSRPFTST